MTEVHQLSFDDVRAARGPERNGRPAADREGTRVALEPLLTAQQIMDHCGIGYHTLLREFRSGRLPALKLAGHWRAELTAYREWLERKRYVPRGDLDVAPAPSLRLSSRSTGAAGSLIRLRAIEEQESR